MRDLKGIIVAAAVAIGLAASSQTINAQSYDYTINGQPAAPAVAQYMANNGLSPGDYWLDAQGYWGAAGNPNPYGNIYAGTYFSRYGSGEQGSNGWSHYDSLSDTSVGGDSNGCYYAGDWSNC